MDIPLDATVYCKNEKYGRSTNFVFNPTTNTLTHFVVREAKRPHTERLLPIRLVERSEDDTIHLSCDPKTAASFIPFNQQEYVVTDARGSHEEAYLWPYAILQPPPKRPIVTQRNLPLYTREVRKGAKVLATDGRVGTVDEFLVNDADQHITHLVMREGHLWDEKEVTIPIEAVDFMEGNTVTLKLSKQDVAQLPAVSIKRPLFQRLW